MCIRDRRQEQRDKIGRALLFGLGDARLDLRQRALGIEYDLKILAPRLIAKPRDPRRLARFVRCTA